MSEQLSINEAAQRLGVSPATVRRRVLKGELTAVKGPGPYGEQYYIPAEEVNTAQNIVDVVQVTRQLSPKELFALLAQANESLKTEVQELRQEVGELRRILENRDIQLVREIRQLMAEKRRPWWARIFKQKGD